jgi:hypothetical protein
MSSVDDAAAWNSLNDWAFAIIGSLSPDSAYEEQQEFLRKLGPMRRGIAGIKWVEGEVFNGGFFQLYTNGGGCWATQAPAGFHLIGRPDFAQLVEMSLQVFPDLRTASVRSLAEAFLLSNEGACVELSEMDSIFYEMMSTKSFAPNLQRFANTYVVDGEVIA